MTELTYEPPGFHLHDWQDGVGLTTHTAYTAFPEPVPKAAEGPAEAPGGRL